MPLETEVAANARAAGPDDERGPRRVGARVERQARAATRILVAIEDRHRARGEAIGEFFRRTRPGVEVRVVRTRGLHTELRRFGPQVVVHAGPMVPIPDLLPCWVELSLDPCLPTVLWTGRVRREILDPSPADLLAVIEEAAPVCL